MAKIFNYPGDDYLVLKCLIFTFSKVKVDCLYLNKDALKPKKENCWELKKYSVCMCIMFY